MSNFCEIAKVFTFFCDSALYGTQLSQCIYVVFVNPLHKKKKIFCDSALSQLLNVDMDRVQMYSLLS